MQGNLIIDTLPEADRQVLSNILEHLPLQRGQTLLRRYERVERVHFPIDAVVSLIAPLSTGEMIESAMVGRDGVVGAGATFSGVGLHHAVVRLGGRSLSCSAEQILQIGAQFPRIAGLLAVHEQVVLAQAQQSAACNAVHTVEARLAKILLRACDLRGSNLLDFTQAQLAAMLGVRRTTVSPVTQAFRRARLIECSRARIHVTNMGGLANVACECYSAVNTYYGVLGPSDNGRPNKQVAG